jgi:putative oxidoreductase
MPVAQKTERIGKSESVAQRRRTEIETVEPARPGVAGITHAILRVGAGLLFFLHGAPKLFGWFGGMGPDGGSAELVSLMGLAGLLEVFGGLAIVLGVATRPVAVVLALEMLIAFFYAHVPRGSLVPYVNGGELALLYASVWIFLAGNGAGPFSVDRTLAARKAVRR